MKGVIILLFCVIFSFTFTEAKFVSGKVKVQQFEFLSKFCFSTVPKDVPSASGTFSWNVKNTLPNNVKIALFDDENNSWPIISKKSCDEKLAIAKISESVNNKDKHIYPRDVANPHFWYVAAVSCNSSEFELDYELSFQNSYGDNKWIREFSCDEIGLEGLYIFFFVFYLILTVVHAYVVYSLIRSTSYHPIVKLLTASIVLEGLSVFSLFVHYVVYGNNGVGAPALKGIGDMLDILAQLVFILLLILIAKGWTITKSTIEHRRVVLIGLGILSAAYIALFIWENVGVDPQSTKYIYQSPPGIIILVIRGLAMLWFLWSIYRTYIDENHPSKRHFYIFFGVLYTGWFLCLPIIAAIASSYRHAWVELKTVTILYVASNALALSVISFLLWPSRANEYFQISSRLDLAGTIPYDAI